MNSHVSSSKFVHTRLWVMVKNDCPVFPYLRCSISGIHSCLAPLGPALLQILLSGMCIYFTWKRPGAWEQRSAVGETTVALAAVFCLLGRMYSTSVWRSTGGMWQRRKPRAGMKQFDYKTNWRKMVWKSGRWRQESGVQSVYCNSGSG